jgi:hypothetical protein
MATFHGKPALVPQVWLDIADSSIREREQRAPEAAAAEYPDAKPFRPCPMPCKRQLNPILSAPAAATRSPLRGGRFTGMHRLLNGAAIAGHRQSRIDRYLRMDLIRFVAARRNRHLP